MEKMYNCDGIPVLVTLPESQHALAPYPYFTYENKLDRLCKELVQRIRAIAKACIDANDDIR